jgi:hypothetical protein
MRPPVKTDSASKLSAFGFIAPLFGVVADYLIVRDTGTPAFGAAAAFVGSQGFFGSIGQGPAVGMPTDPLLNVTKT